VKEITNNFCQDARIGERSYWNERKRICRWIHA